MLVPGVCMLPLLPNSCNKITTNPAANMEVKSSDIHSYYLNIEDVSSLHDWQVWCSQRNNWPLIVIPVYLMAIIYGKNLMRNRKPFNVKGILFLWNVALAVFSIIGTIRLSATVTHHLKSHGWRDSICVNRPDNVTAFWVYLFTMSKFAELGDTLFLVIRKKNVIFLHWYHHCTVLLYTWFAFTHNDSSGKYFILMNYFVHSLMYAYFAAQSVNIKAPRFVSMMITSLQILQMIGGIAVLATSIFEASSGSGCSVHFNILASGLIMYGTYFALFVQFFIQTYFTSRASAHAAIKPIPSSSSAEKIRASVTANGSAQKSGTQGEPVLRIKSL